MARLQLLYSLYQWNTSINVRILTFLPMPSSSTYCHISDMSQFFNGRRTFEDKMWIGGKGFRMWWRNATVHVDFISFSCYQIYYNEEIYFSFFLKAKCVYKELRVDAATLSNSMVFLFLSFFFTRSMRIGNRIKSVLLCKMYFPCLLLINVLTILLITYRIFDDISMKLSTFIYNFISLYRLIINYFRTNYFT